MVVSPWVLPLWRLGGHRGSPQRRSSAPERPTAIEFRDRRERVAMGESDDKDKALVALRKYLEEENNGVKLSAVMVESLMAHLGPTVAKEEEVAQLARREIADELEDALDAYRSKPPLKIESVRMGKWARAGGTSSFRASAETSWRRRSTRWVAEAER